MDLQKNCHGSISAWLEFKYDVALRWSIEEVLGDVYQWFDYLKNWKALGEELHVRRVILEVDHNMGYVVTKVAGKEVRRIDVMGKCLDDYASTRGLHLEGV